MKHVINLALSCALCAGTVLASCSSDDTNEPPKTDRPIVSADGVVTVTDPTFEGFTVTVATPDEVVERGNKLRYIRGSILMYNSFKDIERLVTDADMLIQNGMRQIDSPTETLVFNQANCYLYDDEGNLELDEEGNPIAIDDYQVPGEPSVFLLGEFAYTDEPPYGGYPAGYYDALFDYEGFNAEANAGSGGWMTAGAGSRAICTIDESKYWNGYYSKNVIVNKQPGKLNARLNISTRDLGPRKGYVIIDPDPEVALYLAAFYDDDTFRNQIMPLLDNNEDYLQWFPTSYYAQSTLGSSWYYEGGEFMLETLLNLEPKGHYHVLVTGMGDEEGTTQCFEHFEFDLPDKSEPAPQIVVKGIDNPSGEESPYEVWFNVKSPSHDVKTAQYAANDVRAWETSVLNRYTYSEWVEGRGQWFSIKEVAQINSEEGLDVMFLSSEDTATRMVVMGYNEEGTPNDPDTDGTSVADNRTIPIPDAERVDSELFVELTGEWTASALVRDYSWTEYAYGEPHEMKVPVTISAGIEIPGNLTEEDYKLYADNGFSREQADELFAGLKNEAAKFNAKVRGQNRLLCTGFGFDNENLMTYASPYDLFTGKDYNAYDNAAIINDFGPKWYMQIAAGGSVSVPVNFDKLTPLTDWYDNTTYHLGGIGLYPDIDGKLYAYGITGPAVDDDGSEGEWPKFDVAVSDDRNTLTIKAMNVEGKDADGNPFTYTYYPNAMWTQYTAVYPTNTVVVSEITLTRGSSAAAHAGAAPGRALRASAPVRTNARTAAEAVKPHAMTPMTGEVSVLRRVEGKQIMTEELFRERLLKLAEDYWTGKARK